MIRYDIVQGSDEWHQIRYGMITGTTAGGLFKDTETLFISLLSCRLEGYVKEKPGFENDAMIRGKELEPFARMELSRKAKVKFKEAGWIQNDNIPILGISPDGISECETIGIECKCPSKEVHTETILNDEIPLKNIHQCLHYFTTHKRLKTLHFGSFRPESKIRLFHKVLTLESVINISTKAKPVLGTVLEFSQQARESAKEIDRKIEAKLKIIDL